MGQAPVDATWLVDGLARMALMGQAADQVPAAFEDVVAGMLNMFSPKRYQKYDWTV